MDSASRGCSQRCLTKDASPNCTVALSTSFREMQRSIAAMKPIDQRPPGLALHKKCDANSRPNMRADGDMHRHKVISRLSCKTRVANRSLLMAQIHPHERDCSSCARTCQLGIPAHCGDRRRSSRPVSPLDPTGVSPSGGGLGASQPYRERTLTSNPPDLSMPRPDSTYAPSTSGYV